MWFQGLVVLAAVWVSVFPGVWDLAFGWVSLGLSSFLAETVVQ